MNKNDELLRPFLNEYINELAAEKIDLLKIINNPPNFNSIFYSIKHKLRLRTRIKKILFKWAEKL